MGEYASLAEDLSADLPCGENLEYDPDFQRLEEALRGRPEREYGAARTEAVEPDWPLARKLVLELCSRTRDLRLGCALARVATVQEGLPGLTAALELLARLVSRQWLHVHPRLDSDDEDDPTMRVNALAALVDFAGLQRDLSGASFVRSAAGRCTVREAEAALRGDRPANEGAPAMTRGELHGLIRASQAAGGGNEAAAALAALQELCAALGERLRPDQGPDLAPLERRLKALSDAYNEAVGIVDAAAGGDESMASASAVAHESGPCNIDVPRSPVPSTGSIQSRADIARELDRLAGWLERNEPANPASLLIRRAQRVVQMNFIDILNDLAPEGLPEFVKIAGLPPTDSN